MSSAGIPVMASPLTDDGSLLQLLHMRERKVDLRFASIDLNIVQEGRTHAPK